MTLFEELILSYLQRTVTTSGDPSLVLGMTWKLGGYWGEEVAIRDTCYHFVKLHLRIATSSPTVLHSRQARVLNIVKY